MRHYTTLHGIHCIALRAIASQGIKSRWYDMYMAAKSASLEATPHPDWYGMVGTDGPDGWSIQEEAMARIGGES